MIGFTGMRTHAGVSVSLFHGASWMKGAAVPIHPDRELNLPLGCSANHSDLDARRIPKGRSSCPSRGAPHVRHALNGVGPPADGTPRVRNPGPRHVQPARPSCEPSARKARTHGPIAISPERACIRRSGTPPTSRLGRAVLPVPVPYPRTHFRRKAGSFFNR